jgi:hypothetical protein
MLNAEGWIQFLDKKDIIKKFNSQYLTKPMPGMGSSGKYKMSIKNDKNLKFNSASVNTILF